MGEFVIGIIAAVGWFLVVVLQLKLDKAEVDIHRLKARVGD